MVARQVGWASHCLLILPANCTTFPLFISNMSFHFNYISMNPLAVSFSPSMAHATRPFPVRPQRYSFAISNLPGELRLEIFERLQTADLLSWAYTCNKEYEATVPFIYSWIKLPWRQVDPPVVLLLRTLLDKPSLQPHISRLHLDGRFSDQSPGDWFRRKPKLNVEKLPKGKAFAEIDRRGDRSALTLWKAKVDKGSVDAVATLLLCLCPNLSHIYLDQVYTLEFVMLRAMLHQSQDSCHCPLRHREMPLACFRQLRNVVLEPHPNEVDAYESYRDRLPCTPELACFFQLPNLKTLSLAIGNRDLSQWPVPCRQRFSLYSLLLYRIREDKLGQILACCPRLQSFA